MKYERLCRTALCDLVLRPFSFPLTSPQLTYCFRAHWLRICTDRWNYEQTYWHCRPSRFRIIMYIHLNIGDNTYLYNLCRPTILHIQNGTGLLTSAFIMYCGTVCLMKNFTDWLFSVWIYSVLCSLCAYIRLIVLQIGVIWTTETTAFRHRWRRYWRNQWFPSSSWRSWVVSD